MAKAKELLEEIYDIRLSNKAPYHVQFGSLAANGELANMRHLIDAIIRLCEIVDEQEAEIVKLKGAYATPTNPTGSNPSESL